MKKTFKAVFGASATAATKEDDGEENTDYLEEALSLLRDHRESSYLPAPIAVPSHIVDPIVFPYYQPSGGWQMEGVDVPYIKELQVETVKAAVFIRDDWIRKQMKSRESSFTSKNELRIWAGTYNVN